MSPRRHRRHTAPSSPSIHPIREESANPAAAAPRHRGLRITTDRPASSQGGGGMVWSSAGVGGRFGPQCFKRPGKASSKSDSGIRATCCERSSRTTSDSRISCRRNCHLRGFGHWCWRNSGMDAKLVEQLPILRIEATHIPQSIYRRLGEQPDPGSRTF